MNDVTDEQDQGVLTIDAIDKDWWNAVYLPLSDASAAELVEKAHFAVQYCFQGARGRAEQPDGQWCNAYEPQLSAHAEKGDASQHAEAALERLLELEGRWPQLDRLTGQPDIPESVEALRQEIQQRPHEPETASEKLEDPRGGEPRDGAVTEWSERLDRFDPPSGNEADEENQNTHDFDFSRGSPGRGR